jgi:hypothetical protein
MFTLLVVYFMKDAVRYITDDPQSIISKLHMNGVSLVTIEHNH